VCLEPTEVLSERSSGAAPHPTDVCPTPLVARFAVVKMLGILLAALALTSCNGGTVDRHALTNDASTIASINCEGWLLSDAVARNRVTTHYAREQAEELAIQAGNFADALAHRPTDAGLHDRVRAKGKDAGRLASRLWQLHDRPSDRNQARELARAFKREGCS
jgi:hypothetical protein